MALIFTLSAQPELPSSGAGWLDDLIHVASHFVEYAVLAALVSRAVAPGGRLSRSRMIRVIGWCAAYALGDEWHQSFTPGREATILDLAVDALGALTGCVVYMSRMKDEG